MRQNNEAEQNQKSLQRIFNRAVRHCVRQGALSYDEERSTCKYYHEGKRCAVGGAVNLKTAKMLEREFLGKAIATSKYNRAHKVDRAVCEALKIPPNPYNLEFLARLQVAHDSAYEHEFTASFLRRAKLIAVDFKLKMPSLPAT